MEVMTARREKEEALYRQEDAQKIQMQNNMIRASGMQVDQRETFENKIQLLEESLLEVQKSNKELTGILRDIQQKMCEPHKEQGQVDVPHDSQYLKKGLKVLSKLAAQLGDLLCVIKPEVAPIVKPASVLVGTTAGVISDVC